jgi:hypothetical protein
LPQTSYQPPPPPPPELPLRRRIDTWAHAGLHFSMSPTPAGSGESERPIHTARADMSRPVRTWMPSKSFFFAFAIVHAVTSAALFLWAFSLGMAHLDSGLPTSDFERLVSSASTVLLSPVFTVATRSNRIAVFFPGLLGWLPLIANSALWAVVSWWCVVALSRLRRT